MSFSGCTIINWRIGSFEYGTIYLLSVIKNIPLKLFFIRIWQRGHTNTGLTDYINQLAKIDSDFVSRRESSRDAVKVVMNKLKNTIKNILIFGIRNKRCIVWANMFLFMICNRNQSRKLKANYKTYVITKTFNRYYKGLFKDFNQIPKSYKFYSVFRQIKAVD